MKCRLILAASIALAFAAPAFAQNYAATPPASPANDQAAPADSQPTSSDTQQPTTRKKRHHHHVMRYQSGQGGDNPAAERLTGNEPGTAAYQASNREKRYPAVDHGHVAGDPPVINHSGDHAQVAPTTTTITVPPTR